ncbi:Crotonobetainyl-CoA:carnitine CoA-transferase [Nocardioides dokdonensis FR1436]|uniref:Crotonobetainyl-CoA:carnitine CoA-transferase n=1 Tax=Nocardioides dokdonensis FR1436 TaxID=1300347 RepID=A0A1A9GMU0_9ACTN|nr:CaiB/BaiF CoA-transferase family protein [Nocardioides dokdonensis]ANH38990.1 Crotonobetainyl-CoA:carnitine CoA-transferase [Nocardioides dokdonensis FR1436]
MSRPLTGVRVVEMAGIGPGPHACMVLADLGADVVRVVRPSQATDHHANEHTLRGRRTIVADLKDPADRDRVLDLVAVADVLVEGFRPRVMERLGLGPDDALARNPRLVYGRMTGWGQDGPYAAMAGHDINYISLTGALHAIGTSEQPVPPLNLVGDYGGGSMLLVTGVLAALVQRGSTGTGQVVDAAMVDGTSLLLAGILELRTDGTWNDERSNNLLDGAAPFYATYRCADGGFMAVGAIEPQFYALLVAGLGLEPASLPDRDDTTRWGQLRSTFAVAFGAQPRAHWESVFDGSDACVTPVLDFDEAVQHPHVVARRSLTRDSAGFVAAGRAPRMRDDESGVVGIGSTESWETVLAAWGGPPH